METNHQDEARQQKWNTSQVSVRFVNAAHLADCLDHLRKTDQLTAFWEKVGYLVLLFRHDAIGFRGKNYAPPELNEPISDPPRKPRNIVIWMSPDSFDQPSFVWRAEVLEDIPGKKAIMLMHGGMIYRGAEGWTIHT